MNKRFDPFLPYAETHYKFKLPWSPLHKPWPEIFIDGPSFCVPGLSPTFYLAVKDADYFPVIIRQIEFLIVGDRQERKQTLAPDLRVDSNLLFHPLSIDFAGLKGELQVNAKVTVENAKGRRRSFLNSNFPGLAPSPLKIRLFDSPLPYPSDWHAGEMHCHSDYSNDPVEYGAPLCVLQEAGSSLGLGFVLCTDHSYDFYYDKTRYMHPTDPEKNFQNYRSEALALNHGTQNSNRPILIPGEEVSCGNHLGENVHLLVAGHENFLPGLGDGGRRWLNNKPDLKIAEVLERLGDVPCFAAHPRVRVGALERFLFRRGMWHEPDVAHCENSLSIQGLQFWNGHRGRDFQEGHSFWIKQLLAGNRLFPIGANDAHGDLNQNIGVKTPLFSLYQSRSHVFGKVRTVVQAKEKSIAGIQAGLRAGKLFATDGPFLGHQAEGARMQISVASIPEFGACEKIAVFAGSTGEAKESMIKEWAWEKNGPMTFAESLEMPSGMTYVRAEARTTEKRFAIANPLFL